MLAAPYTKWHCSQWNVDQAAALLLCSVEAADRAGVPRRPVGVPARGGGVEPHGAGVAARRSCTAARRCAIGERPLAEPGGIDLAAVDHVDLYSCFPAAVRVQAAELGLDDRADR